MIVEDAKEQHSTLKKVIEMSGKHYTAALKKPYLFSRDA